MKNEKNHNYIIYLVTVIALGSVLVLFIPQPEQAGASSDSLDFGTAYNQISSSGIETGSGYYFPQPEMAEPTGTDEDTGDREPASTPTPRPNPSVQVRVNAKPNTKVQGGGVAKSKGSANFNLDRLAYAVAMAETKNCKLGYGASHNNCFGIKKGRTVPCKTEGFRKMCVFSSPEESYEAFKKIWSTHYKSFPTLRLASIWTGNDNAHNWLRIVSHYYY